MQITETVDLATLWYFSAYSQICLGHARLFARAVGRLGPGADSLVAEATNNDGYAVAVKPDLLDVIVCPACRAYPLRREVFDAGSQGDAVDAVVLCPQCSRWYPVEDRLLELLAGEVVYRGDRERFWHKHEASLRALGLDREPSSMLDEGRAEDVRHQQEHFDWYADNSVQTYAQYESLRFWRALDAITFEKWRREMRPGARVLDLGCAQGRSTRGVVTPEVDVIGFDISRALVRQAVDRFGADARVAFMVADATSLPFADESFDYVLVYGVLHHLPDPARICKQIARVLRPGGVLFTSENNRSILRAGFTLLQKLWPIWYEEAGEHAQISRDQLTKWLEDAGLRVSTRTSVFLPPHVLNHIPTSAGERLLAWTDRIGNAVPVLRDNGGLVVAEAVKAPA